MSKKQTVYKIYKDIIDLSNKDRYLRTLNLGIGTTIGTFISYGLVPNNSNFIAICSGASIGFLGVGIYNACKFMKAKKSSRSIEKRFKIFQEEAKKVLNKDVNLDFSKVIKANENIFIQSESSKNYEYCNNMVFEDGGYIKESLDGNYKCEYYMPFLDELGKLSKVNLTDAANLAYSKTIKKRKG